MNISFVTSGHDPFDDRIFFHMAKTLLRHKHSIRIISSKRNVNEVVEGVELYCFSGDKLSKRNKTELFLERLKAFKPDVIVCSEPLTLLAAKKYSGSVSGNIRIVYDVTEWYPSKKNLSGYKPVVRWYIFLKLLFFNLWVCGFADSFIFGEYYKSTPYKFLHPRKPFIFVSYFPDLIYIPLSAPDLREGKLRLSYSGKISLEKGYGNFSRVIYRLSEINKDLLIEVKIIGWYETVSDRLECEKLFTSVNENVSFQIFGRQEFNNYPDLIKDTDIFLDLRADDFENQHCLPVKLFYYAALGRPVIMSDLKAIRKEVDLERFGYLVNPCDTDSIIQIISEYLTNRELYNNHCRNARKLSEENYNWKRGETEFVNFLSRQ